MYINLLNQKQNCRDDSGMLPRLMSEVVMASHDLAHPDPDLRPPTSNIEPDLAPTKFIHAL